MTLHASPTAARPSQADCATPAQRRTAATTGCRAVSTFCIAALSATLLTTISGAAFAQGFGHGSQGALRDAYKVDLDKNASSASAEQTAGALAEAPSNRFGRLFDLNERFTDAEGRRHVMRPLNASIENLRSLGAINGPMHEKGDAESRDSNLPAGYVFLGQFIDHDITFDTVSTLDERIDEQETENARTPTLDLDSVYGGGPERTPHLYNLPYLAYGNSLAPGRYDLLRRTTVSNNGSGQSSAQADGQTTREPAPQRQAQPAPAVQSEQQAIDRINDLLSGGDDGYDSQPRQPAPRPRDPAPAPKTRIPDRYKKYVVNADVALIGDPRNDENVVISQLHGAFIAFHNRIVDLLLAERGINLRALEARVENERDDEQRLVHQAALFKVQHDIFEAARDHTIHYYHRIILEDYLPRIIGFDRVQRITRHGRRFYFPNGFQDRQKGGFKGPYIPVEFSVAAFRYGHSQVRNLYNLSGGLKEVPLFGRSGVLNMMGFKPITRDLMIDWHYFFPMTRETLRVMQSSRPLDTRLPAPLFRLDLGGVTPPGDVASLASRNMNRGAIFSLPSGQAIARRMGLPRSQVLAADTATRRILGTDETPLWYYILQEAKQQGIVLASNQRYGIPKVGKLAASDVVYAANAASAQTAAVRQATGSNGGDILGPVGGTIVGEVLHGLLEHYRITTGHGLDFKSEIDGRMTKRTIAGFGELYDMPAMITDAGVGAIVR